MHCKMQIFFGEATAPDMIWIFGLRSSNMSRQGTAPALTILATSLTALLIRSLKDQYFKLHKEFLEPLAPYVANTLLTTLGPSFDRESIRWSNPLPHYEEIIILKDAL